MAKSYFTFAPPFWSLLATRMINLTPAVRALLFDRTDVYLQVFLVCRDFSVKLSLVLDLTVFVITGYRGHNSCF
jgi:hypothetical protein